MIPKRMRLLLAVIVLNLLTSCRGRHSPTETQAARPYKLPTATEVFELRSKCAALGEKVLENSIVGPALSQTQVTHYNPQTNRCYVNLVTSPNDLRTPLDQFIVHRSLYDGQTHEMLVLASAEGRQMSAYISNGFVAARRDHPTGALANYDDAIALIEKYMADDRQQ